MIRLHAMGSPNVLKIILMLEEVGLTYEVRRCDVVLGKQHEPQFLALNPNAKVPVIVDDEGPDGEAVTIFESGAILIYLAEKVRSFLPAQGPARYRVLQWLMFQMAAIGPIAGNAIHMAHVAGQQGYARDRFVNELHRLFGVADRHLDGNAYLAGADYSIADMALFPWVGTVKRFFPSFERLSHLEHWAERVGGRPAAVRMAEIGNALAAQDRLSFKAATGDQLDRYFGRTAAS